MREPVTFTEKGRISALKERFWAKWYAEDHKDLFFELSEDRFYRYDELSGLFVQFPSKLVNEGLSQALLAASRCWGNQWADLDRFNSSKIIMGIALMLSGMIGRTEFFFSSTTAATDHDNDSII
jgi:hypothetical protein